MSVKGRKIKRIAMFILCLSSLLIFTGCGTGDSVSGENSSQTESSDVPKDDSGKEDDSGDISKGENENAGDGETDGSNSGEDKSSVTGGNNSGTDSSGSSEKNDILSEEKIKEIVLEDSKIDSKDAFFIKVRLEREKGVLVYDVEFYVGDKEYEYKVNPTTGKILEKEIEDKDD